jgi:hypothetical protein
MNHATGCIIHESTKGMIQPEGTCEPQADVWKGNIADIQACGDIALVNPNIKDLERILHYVIALGCT